MLLAFSSCLSIQHEDVCADNNSLRITVEEAETRVYIDGDRTLLHSEDPFSVFYNSPVNEQWVYVGANGTTDGMLSHKGDINHEDEPESVYAVYPWCSSASLSEGVVSTVLAQTQFYAEESFGEGAAILAAASDSRVLHFRYATGFVKLTLTGEAQVSDIVLSSIAGEPIAGECTIDLNGNRPVLTAVGSSSVLLRNHDSSPMAVQAVKNFIFSVAPGVYNKGLTFTISYTTGQTQTLVVSEPFIVTAGGISTPVEAKCQPQFSLTANFFVDGQNAVNPFANTIDRGIIPGETGSTSESDDQFLITDSAKKYPFRFYIQDKSVSDHLRITKSGLNFGGMTGDYILLPGVEGKRLSSVLIVADIVAQVGVNAGESVALVASKPNLINVTGAEEGQACKMELRQDSRIRMQNITLYYDSVL